MSYPNLHRIAREADLDRLVEIHSAAFPDPRGPEARRRNFVHNPLGVLDDLHVVERDGIPVAHAFLFHLEAWFGGRRVPVGAIASVGVAPEARGLGVATALLGHLHRVARDRGAALTLLYPFRQGYYGRFGYAPVTPTKRLEICPRSIPAAWSTEGGTVRAMHVGDREGILAAYDRAASRTTGWLARAHRLWEKLALDERRRWSVLEREGKVAGYVAWELEQAEPHARTTATVHELVADDDGARRKLLGMLRGLHDQVASITLEVAIDDPLDRALVDADGHRFGSQAVEHTLGTLSAGPMVRVDDLPRAIEARGYRAGVVGDVVLEVDEDGTAVVLDVAVHDTRARAKPSTRAPGLAMSRTTLAALLFGGLTMREARALGFVQVRDEAALEMADAMLALPPFFAIDRF
jgi:predicted acetyltransferase